MSMLMNHRSNLNRMKYSYLMFDTLNIITSCRKHVKNGENDIEKCHEAKKKIN